MSTYTDASAASHAMQHAAFLDEVCSIAASLSPDVLRGVVDSHLYDHVEGEHEPKGNVQAHGLYWTDSHYVHAGDDGTFSVRERDDIKEDEDVLPRVEDDAGDALDGDEILPGGFTYRAADGTEYAYRHTGPEEYEVRLWMPDEGMWWVEGSEMIGDEVTVETFLTIKQNS